ncbi:MAG: CHAD domain-containing protein [Acidobacteriota bacterium]|nr:MAG: CHAD domain-containing protein [Acidobacteriota bacterium]
MAKPFKIRKVTPQTSLPEAAGRILRTRLREFYSHLQPGITDPTPEQLHALRISGKRLRYTSDCLRELYPDQLEMIIDMLKRVQDLLGEMQDCIVFSSSIEEDLRRLRKRKPESTDIPVLEKLVSDYRQRHEALSAQFLNLWHGMSQKGIRKGLRRMVEPTAG